MKQRITTIPFRDWPWHARVIEKLYRRTHGGAGRTIVIRDEDRFERWFHKDPDGKWRYVG